MPQVALGARPASLAKSRVRPLFISPNTGDVHVFIGTSIGTASVASGSLATCTAATGTGTGCSIPWTTSLAVPGSYVFTVEIDTGTTHTPNYTVLAEGAGTYALVAGTNTLTPALSLNGVVTNATFNVAACTPAGASPTNCNGTVVLAASGGSAIAYTGALTPPTYGNSPTSGNVFDNAGPTGAADVTLTSTAPSVGTVTGTAQTPYSTYTSPTLTIAGVNATGTYSFAVGCVAGANGTFGITVGGGTTPSGDVTSAELAALTGPVVYPTSGVVTNPTAPSFTCTAGVINSASGTLPVN